MALHIWIYSLLLLLLCWLRGGHSLSVLFANHKPVYVERGQSLTLQARVERLEGERVVGVLWEHQAMDSGRKQTLAEFPGRESEGRAIVEQQGVRLKVRGYEPADAGIYIITITDQSGQRSSAEQIVQEYLAVHHVSVMVNVSHSVLHCMEAWGTQPSFSWLHQDAAVSEKVARVSEDGTSLFVSGSLCGRFTCVVSNRLGHSSASYTAEPCEGENSRATTAVISFLLLMLLLVVACLIFLLWRRCRQRHNSRERLREVYEEPL